MPFRVVRPVRIGYADLRRAALRSRGFGDTIDAHNNLVVRTLSAGDIPCLADTDYGPLQPGQTYCSGGLVPIPCMPDGAVGPLQPGQLYCSGASFPVAGPVAGPGGGFCLAASFPFFGTADPYGGCQPAAISKPALIAGAVVGSLVLWKLFTGGRR